MQRTAERRYLPCADGNTLNLATVIDCFSAGWLIADHMLTGLATDALPAPAATRGGLAERCSTVTMSCSTFYQRLTTAPAGGLTAPQASPTDRPRAE